LTAASAQRAAIELKRLGVEELLQIDVTSIADALALADGVHVARLNNGSCAASARGFDGSTPNRLPVMVDDRTVYSPLCAGVFWNMRDYVLEAIDRIEVMSLPGPVVLANILEGQSHGLELAFERGGRAGLTLRLP
jgi:iron complex outermembrane receptor protein